MKLFARRKNFCEAMAPVITLYRLIGLRAFEYPRGRPRPILSLIYFLFLYGLFYGSKYLQGEYYSHVGLHKLEYFVYEKSDIIVNYFIFVKLLLGWWYTKKFQACYRKVFEIDETLRQLGSAVNYDRMYFTILGVMFVWFLLNLFTCIMVFIVTSTEIQNVSTTASYSMALFYMLTVSSCIIFEFCILVKCLQMKFKLINKLLYESMSALPAKEIKLGFFEMKDYAKIMDVERQKCFIPMKILSYCRQKQLRGELRNRSQRHNFVMTKGQKHMYLLQIIKQVHLELCKVSKTICMIFGVQIVSEIGITIIFLTASLYALYIRYIQQQQTITNILMHQTVLIILSCVVDILKITFLSCVCEDAADEGNKTIEIVYSIYGCNTESGMQEEIQQFGIQMLQSPVRFSAYGISLDNRVLTMILKIVITYLVIMIQVSNLLESDETIQNA